MSKITILHNPRCSKSREALKILEDNGITADVVKYLEEHPSAAQLKNIVKMLGIKSAREMMRTKEDIYKELDLKNEHDEEKLIEAMAEHPKLIERPIIIKGDKAIIARPPQKAEEFLKV
ncbi:arsenate reductase (glutaredoxin) [Sulfurimonas autotrophica]|uniref:Arsenate reductase n=1 Tax=Sulfurimonas autotrophica (strain ATCC BAA-671 / DSM 16294 / JCM 11897 / OK10) TaxID=563040 RepID=E0URI5_SULAO|nr:arsenate reductase (glutaredoxin) [Sulfurimonas autotrophica]ADN10071.1 arsenate reductase [Sulfurimonas autotrophica DSM 16294]